jgi:PIN domain nuclease of toxin-antitoxin system
MAEAILDASAVLAVIHGEPGAEMVVAALQDALILAVNYAEVISKLVERGATYEQADAAIGKFAVPVVDFDLDLARRTGALRASTRSRGLSLGDRACLALGEREQIPILTSDRRWADALPGVTVQLIR